MNEIYERGYTVPEEGISDSDAINRAVMQAKEMGLCKTVIPRYNKRLGACRWELDTPVLIPDGFTFVLDNAEIAFSDNGTLLAMGEERKPLEHIHIYGTGNARLTDEGVYGAMIRLAFVRSARIHGIAIQNRTARGIFCLGVTESVLSDITFDGNISTSDTESEGRRKSAGGIMLSAGCRDVTVTHIFGKTNGHGIEVSAFSGETESDITRNITIRDIHTDCGTFSNVRLVNADGHMLQGIMIDGVTDTSREGGLYRGRATVTIGDAVFGRMPAALGEIRDITVKNITSRAYSAVNVVNSVQDITVADISIRDDGGCALSCDRTLEYNNIYLCNIKFDDRTAPPYPIAEVRKVAYIQPPEDTTRHIYPYRAVCNMRDIHGNNFKINGIYANMVDNLLRITGKNRLEMYDVDVLNIVYDDIVGEDCMVNEEF